MAKATTAKSRYIIAIILLVVSLCAITGALIGVYAASIQGTSSSFYIQYSMGQHIAVEVSAKYQIVNETMVDLGKVSFNVGETEDTGFLGTDTIIILTPGKTYVDFTYTFKNLSKTQYARVSSSWKSFATDVSNIVCSYVITTDEVGSETTLSSADDFSQMALVLSPDKTYSIRIRFSVDDSTANAYVSSSTSKGLAFDVQYLKP